MGKNKPNMTEIGQVLVDIHCSLKMGISKIRLLREPHDISHLLKYVNLFRFLYLVVNINKSIKFAEVTSCHSLNESNHNFQGYFDIIGNITFHAIKYC